MAQISSVHRRTRQRQRLSLRQPKSSGGAGFSGYCAIAGCTSILALWLCATFISPSSPEHSSRHLGNGKNRRESPPQKPSKERRGLGYLLGGRSRSQPRHPRVVGNYAYQLTGSVGGWKTSRINNLPPYVYITERIDPYLLSHASQALRRIRHHVDKSDHSTLHDFMKNSDRAIVGSGADVETEDPLRHLMLSSSSREQLRTIRDGSEEYESYLADPLEDERCVPVRKNAEWSKTAFQICNPLHEFDFSGSVGRGKTGILGSGYWRDVWPVTDLEPTRHQKVVLKTIRYEHDYTERNYQRHVRDAIVSERLTPSPHVTNTYAFCGHSGYFEFATGGSLNDRLEKNYMAKMESRQERPSDDDSKGDILDQNAKLNLALQVSLGLADFHDAYAMRDKDGKITSAFFVHADITTDQFVLVDGVYKLNDFNRCRFMRQYRNSADDGGDRKPCGFKIGNNPGTNRAPEEYAYALETEKVDIFSMGNVIYNILTDLQPWDNYDEEEAQKNVMKGKRPKIPKKIENSDDPVDVALLKMIRWCWEHKPRDRPRAREVADYLSDIA
ncbi:hypothetical protein ACHAWF_005024 [Thalassiosira exigua]